jgi:hypothetical protein
MLREPGVNLVVVHAVDQTFNSIVVLGRFNLQVNDEVQVVPYKVVVLVVGGKPFFRRYPVKLSFSHATNEALILGVVVVLVVLCSQLGKSVNNDTKDNIQ